MMEFSASEAYVHDMSHIASGGKSIRQSVMPRARPRREKGMSRPEVHVTTEHITMTEFPWVFEHSDCS